jgi:hypothetical protein
VEELSSCRKGLTVEHLESLGRKLCGAEKTEALSEYLIEGQHSRPEMPFALQSPQEIVDFSSRRL